MNYKDLMKQAASKEVQDWINVNLRNYITKKGEMDVSTAEHIIDFLNSDKAPSRLRKMSVKQAKKSAEKWTKTLIKKAKNIYETEEERVQRKQAQHERLTETGRRRQEAKIERERLDQQRQTTWIIAGVVVLAAVIISVGIVASRKPQSSRQDGKDS